MSRNRAHTGDTSARSPAADVVDAPCSSPASTAGAVPGVAVADPESRTEGTAPTHRVVVDGPALTLPGLDDARGTTRPVAPLEQAVRQTLQHLAADGALTPADAGRVALAIELAQIIGDKRATRRTSTVGNDARVLMDILDELAPAAGSEADQQLRATMDVWSAAIAAQEQAARDASTEVRDPA